MSLLGHWFLLQDQFFSEKKTITEFEKKRICQIPMKKIFLQWNSYIFWIRIQFSASVDCFLIKSFVTRLFLHMEDLPKMIILIHRNAMNYFWQTPEKKLPSSNFCDWNNWYALMCKCGLKKTTRSTHWWCSKKTMFSNRESKILYSTTRTMDYSI